MKPRLVKFWEFPDVWRAKKPTRVWGVLEPRTKRVRSFTTRATAERWIEIMPLHNGVLLKLWFDGCMAMRKGRMRRGFLTNWQEASEDAS